MKHTVEVNGIKIYAFHGCLPEEAKIGNNYIVDDSDTTDVTNATVSDAIKDTVDYASINSIVVKEMKVRSKLIEHVGQRIVDRIKSELENITHLRVKVTNISPPVGGGVDNVAIIIEG
jgi:dihydroneopterin aldolase